MIIVISFGRWEDVISASRGFFAFLFLPRSALTATLGALEHILY